jgi:hypothetical protein
MRLLGPIQIVAEEAVGLRALDLYLFAICKNKCHKASMAVEMIRIQDLGKNMAEREGFEPPVPFQVQRFSRPPVSTTHTSLRAGGYIHYKPGFYRTGSRARIPLHNVVI